MMTALVSGGRGWPVLIQKASLPIVNCLGCSMVVPKVSSASDGDAVHGGGMKIGRRKPGKYRFGQNPSQSFRGRDLLSLPKA